MRIDKVKIRNFKGFRETFSMQLNAGVNILVGDNEAGKSTILEAINLALTGSYNGRFIRGELSQYFFNQASVAEYIESLKADIPLPPPEILIELYFDGPEECPLFEGDGNSDGRYCAGLSLRVEFDDDYTDEYNALIDAGDVQTVPIEYYRVTRKSFARTNVTNRTIPIKSALIDSSTGKGQSGSDVYIGRIVRELLSPEEVVSVAQSHRRMRDHFMADPAVAAINEKVAESAKITEKQVTISVELASSNAWETSLTTYLDNIPFHFVGKGEQTVVKTNLAIAHDKAQEANLILIEEPENHLSHTKLNQLLRRIKEGCDQKQILVTTHSSFVANKLGLDELILLNDKMTLKLDDLSPQTKSFFEKVSGYDTLRLILCKRAILVEGDSDELVVQRAYMEHHDGQLPIEDGVEVISVGTAFLRFLEIARHLNCTASVVTDNDGDPKAIRKKYSKFLGSKANPRIKICYDAFVDEGPLMIGRRPFNYNTLEPKLLKANSLDVLNAVFGSTFTDEDELRRHMLYNKTDCALKVFDYPGSLHYPQYILDAVIQ